MQCPILLLLLLNLTEPKIGIKNICIKRFVFCPLPIRGIPANIPYLFR